MKLPIIVSLFLFLFSSVLSAQNVTDFSVPKESQEEYISELFSQCKLLYCDWDTIKEGVFIKKIEVEFLDTTFFFSAMFQSSSFDYYLHEYGWYDCTSLRMDDGGKGLYLDAVALDIDFPYLKHVLNTLLHSIDRFPYQGDYLEDPDWC